MSKIKPSYFPYTEWECFKNGMYSLKRSPDQDQQILKSLNLLSNPGQLRIKMYEVVNSWPITSSQHLSKNTLNRRSWLGQAACFLDHGISEFINRLAWNQLTNEQMKEANKVADEVIKYWESKQ